jgi:hypothetical protein
MQFIGDLLLLEGFSGDPLITGVVLNEQYVNRLSRRHERCLSQGPGEAGDAEAHATAHGASICPPPGLAKALVAGLFVVMPW